MSQRVTKKVQCSGHHDTSVNWQAGGTPQLCAVWWAFTIFEEIMNPRDRDAEYYSAMGK